MRSAKEINDLFKTLRYRIYANRTNDGTPEGCEQAMDDSIRIEYVADEFAIGFAEWFVDNTLRVDLDGYKTFGDADETAPHTVKELLEIYKKEKGL